MTAVIERLFSVLGDAGRFVRRDRTSKLIADLIETPSHPEQLSIINELSHLGDRRAVDALATLARSHHRLALAALDALGTMPAQHAENAVLGFLDVTDTEVVVRACDWMAAHGSERSLPALVRVVEGIRLPAELEVAAKRAIARVENRKAFPEMMTGRLSVHAVVSHDGDLSLTAQDGELSEASVSSHRTHP